MIQLIKMEGCFSIHRYPPGATIPPTLFASDWFTVSSTPEELSVVCRCGVLRGAPESSFGWTGFKIDGPLAFTEVGILARISGVMAEAGIPVFTVSTYDTDYLFIARGQAEQAEQAIRNAGFQLML